MSWVKSDEEHRSKYCNCRREYVNLLENKKQRWLEIKSEHTNSTIKLEIQKKFGLLEKTFEEGINTKCLDPDRCLRHFAKLCTNNNNEILLKEVQILGPAYINKLDDVFTTHEVKKILFRE
jgi:hypothetical protein